ncbi:uncharacterized protein RAG0_03565 [Rhynchosporium agropyri]|uniref:Homeobox domain-containing protein n=1 Tax=Rhynchosporium agropyri TaxID=914238 RepID=A0A1E1K4X9_9HELO|nr:uncharacterized protein RAG0_03565 [Rhynchosporium agropyri]
MLFTDTYHRLGRWDSPKSQNSSHITSPVQRRSVMEHPQSLYPSQPWESSRSEGTKMPALSIRPSPGHHLPGPSSLLDSRLQGVHSIPRSECRSPSQSAQLQMSPVQLPPIRELVDLSGRGERRKGEYRANESPTSIGKRRRTADEENDGEDSRESTFPRINRSPRMMDRPHSAATVGPTRHASTAYDTHSARSSPYQSRRGLPAMRSSPSFELPTRQDDRPTLPSLPSMMPAHNSSIPRSVQPLSDYAFGSPRQSLQTYPPLSATTYEPATYQQPSTYAYGYPPRGHSYPGPVSSYPNGNDRSPFSSAQHAMYPNNMSPYGSEGHDREGDTRQRKRRGNLPKETTDKLRTWFMAHLTHPYPTEDEKQELMRQTGLQMNQISNWFINARRRQLPAMINNARAESTARSARAQDGQGQSTSCGNTQRGSSEGDESAYDD